MQHLQGKGRPALPGGPMQRLQGTGGTALPGGSKTGSRTQEGDHGEPAVLELGLLQLEGASGVAAVRQAQRVEVAA